MKAALFRKDNYGAVVGRLKSPTELQYEDNGHVRIFNLLGKIVETEYNDVLILGKRINDNEFYVEKMESIPKDNEDFLGLYADGEEGRYYSLAIPKSLLVSIDEKPIKTGILYTFHFALSEKRTLFLNTYDVPLKDVRTDSYIFLLKKALEKEEKQYGIGYAVKKWTNMYGHGIQLLS